MIAKETTKNRTFTLEVDEEEMKILHSLVGACGYGLFTPNGAWDPVVSARLNRMWNGVISLLGDELAYDLRVTRA